MRDGEITLTSEITTALLAMLDAIRAILRCIEQSGSEGDETYNDIIAVFERLNTTGGGQSSPCEAEATSAASSNPVAAAQTEIVESAVEPLLGATDELRVAPEPQREQQGKVADTTVRVDVGVLDKLMNLVGELVLTRNQIMQFVGQRHDTNLMAACEQLDLLTSELQEGIMKTRMQPIRTVWGKLPRVVRDLAAACKKKVRVVMEGEDTELDRTIIEAVKDPLTHIVRNSVDHGLETPAARVAAGKPEEGTIKLSARHEGGQVVILISDDGAGLNVERIRDKAVQRGLLPRERAELLSDRELMNLIFTPGFSTAEHVSNISGRGVGMDVVKTYIERIGGSVDLHSERGVGTTICIRIPLTLAIVPALIVTCLNSRYAIPQINVLEIVRLDGGTGANAIEYVHNAPVYRLRGKLLPLVDLRAVLHPADTGDASCVDSRQAATYIVALLADDRVFGLVVDAVLDTQEIVVKPLSKHFRGVDVYAGATIMGDGSVAMILDATGIARLSGLTRHSDRVVHAVAPERSGTDEVGQRYLLVGANDLDRVAFPLDAVARLEEINPKLLESAGTRKVVQYRNEIMPLVDLQAVLGENPSVGAETVGTAAPLRVVVCRNGMGHVGVIVREILDVVEEALAVKANGTRRGVQATGVLQGRVTEIVDMDFLFRATGLHETSLVE